MAIQPAGQAAPPGFESVTKVHAGGTIYPGLIERHNHLAYNALPLWSPVPKRFEHRGQWPGHADYRRLISGPMTVIGQYRDAQGRPSLLAPLVRYVECQCLLGGVTTSQGIMLNSNAGIQRYHRGILRNVEQTDDTDRPEAQGRIADVVAKDARSFWGRLQKEDSCFLLHLSEGLSAPGQTDAIARRHFLALEVAPGEWAINNRLGELKVAWLYSQHLLGGLFSARDLVTMATRDAARSALQKALRQLPALALEIEQPRQPAPLRATLDAPEPIVWSLSLDEIQATAVDLRPRLPFDGPTEFTGPERVAPMAAAMPLSALLQPIALDPRTVADDRDFLVKIAGQPNLPDAVRNGLAALY